MQSAISIVLSVFPHSFCSVLLWLEHKNFNTAFEQKLILWSKGEYQSKMSLKFKSFKRKKPLNIEFIIIYYNTRLQWKTWWLRCHFAPLSPLKSFGQTSDWHEQWMLLTFLLKRCDKYAAILDSRSFKLIEWQFFWKIVSKTRLVMSCSLTATAHSLLTAHCSLLTRTLAVCSCSCLAGCLAWLACLYT